jgi:tetratricopeptide (TPR) repeat protein
VKNTRRDTRTAIDEPAPDGTPSQLWRVDAACDSFEAAWRADGRPRIETYLVAGAARERRPLVRELVALEVELRQAGGDRPSRDEYRARFPELNHDEIESVFGRPNDQEAPAQSRYRLVRRLARGGLGEVSLVHDEVLRRDVALKEILRSHAGDPDRRARFLREARVTGALEHPGIVPVHDAGRRDDGRPYYVMRLLRESSLKDAIADFHRTGEARAEPSARSVAFRGLVRRVVDVCNAIGYAHSRGIIHRDLKPANIMLGSFGETLVVDWGLARFYDRQESPEDGQASGDPDDSLEATCTGQALGTPRYMSPEQARGDRSLGPPCDVYGLGAILYTVISGRAPIDGGDTATVLERVRLGAVAPPRHVNPDVPAALAAVALKAMSLLPEDRYESARALAIELERWLAGEPVSVWPEPLWRRVRRTIGRHRTAVAVTAVAIAGLVAVLAEAGWHRIARQHQEKQNLTALLNVKVEDNRVLDLARLREKDARESAQARFALALEAVHANDAYLTGEMLFNDHPLRAVRRKLLVAALEFDRQLEVTLKAEDDPAALELLANAYAKTARLYCGVGDKRDALEAVRRSAAAALRLARARPDESRFELKLGRALSELGGILWNLDERSESMAVFERCREVLEGLARSHPTAENRRGFFRAHLNIAILRSNLGDTAAAAAAFVAARDGLESLARGSGDPRDRLELAVCLIHRGLFDGSHGGRKEGLNELARARGILEQLVASEPGNELYRIDLAFSDMHAGILLEQAGRDREAIASHLRARETRERLLRENPGLGAVRFDLVRTCAALGDLYRKDGNLDGAIREYTASLDMAERQVREDPDVNWNYSGQGEIHRKLAGALRRMGRPADAVRYARAAVSTYEAHPRPGADDWYNLACAYAQLADTDTVATAKAVSAFARAKGAGYRNARQARTELDLGPVWGDPLFQAMIMDLEFPVDAFEP